jgi:hypothetical protein
MVSGIFFAVDRCQMRRIFIGYGRPIPNSFPCINPFPETFSGNGLMRLWELVTSDAAAPVAIARGSSVMQLVPLATDDYRWFARIRCMDG